MATIDHENIMRAPDGQALDPTVRQAEADESAARDALRALILSIPVETDRQWRKLLGLRDYPAEARQHDAAVERATEAVKAAEARAACARSEVLGRHRTRDQAVSP